MATLSINDLFKHHAHDLALQWIAGREGGGRTVCLERKKKLGNVGYLNLIHPHCIQIIGSYELDYLKTLSEKDYQEVLDSLFYNDELVCIIITDSCTILPELRIYTERHRIPLFSSQLSGESVINYLHSTFARLLAERTTLHGVFMDVFGMGVLIMGSSGTGKSELALELVSRGHRLIADDSPEFSKVAPNAILGACPLNMTPFLEVRGLGILNVQALFGESAIKKDKYLKLIVQLEHMTSERLQKIDRLQGDYRIRKILGVDVAEIGLPVAPGRNLSVLLECAVRNHNLKMQGYNAADEFCELQRQAMQQFDEWD